MQITKVSVRKKHANYMLNIWQKNVEHLNEDGAEACTKRISFKPKNVITYDTYNTKTYIICFQHQYKHNIFIS